MLLQPRQLRQTLHTLLEGSEHDYGGGCSGKEMQVALELVLPVLFFPGSSNARKHRGGIYDLNSKGTWTSARMGEGEDGARNLARLCLKKWREEAEQGLQRDGD